MATCVVKWPDVEKAAELDEDLALEFHSELGIKETMIDKFFENFTCKSVAQEGRNWLTFISVIHLFSIVACIQRELFDTKLGRKWRFLLLNEVACIKLYLVSILVAMKISSIFFYFKNL